MEAAVKAEALNRTVFVLPVKVNPVVLITGQDPCSIKSLIPSLSSSISIASGTPSPSLSVQKLIFLSLAYLLKLFV